MTSKSLPKLFRESQYKSKFLVAAPMAGVMDRAMRELCMAAGAAFCCSEMVSCMGVSFFDRKSQDLMALSPAEQPAGIQLFGKEPSSFCHAAEAALKQSPAFIDLNLGCPAHKVAGHGSGSALMKSPELTKTIISETVRAVSGAVPVSVKMRAGWEDSQRNAVEISKLCEQSGAAWVTIHGRTRQQMYAPPVDLEIIRAVKAAISIPVIGNGDVIDGPSARTMLEKTGCDLLMIGRAALGCPWIFTEISKFLLNDSSYQAPTLAQRLDFMLHHVRLLLEYKGSHIGIREARKHAAWYLKGSRGSAQLRQAVVQIESLSELEEISEMLLKQEDL